MRLTLRKTILNFLKKLIACFCAKGIEKLCIKKEYAVISFDVFDTLICRSVDKPTDVFDLMQKELEIKGKWNYSFSFKEVRKSAERMAKGHNAYREAGLDEIYNEMHQLNEYEKKSIMDLEINTELSCCYPNLEVVKRYDEIITSGTRVVLTSDMYLSSENMKVMLDKCGIVGYERLYVSSEVGVNKKYGKLFDYILKDLSLSRNGFMHIGDDPWGDFLVPKLRGIKVFLYKANR